LDNNQDDHQASVVEIEGMIFDHLVSILIDPGSNLSYIAPKAVDKCKLQPRKKTKTWLVQLATGTKRKVVEVIPAYQLMLGEFPTQANLNVLPLVLSLKFRPHRATRTLHRQHRKTVIHGTRINSTAQQKGQNYTKLAKKLKSASRPWKTRARAQHLRTSSAYARLWGAKPARLPNGAFMKLVGLPTTNGSAPKSI
jgi:hypothetical protein